MNTGSRPPTAKATAADETETLAQRARLLLVQASASPDGARLDEAIDILRRALADVPADHPANGTWLHNLAVALRLRFARHGRIDDVHEAVDLGTRAVARTPAGHAARADRLNSLAMALSERFGALGNLEDLDLAVECGRSAVAGVSGLDDSDVLLANLAIDLATRHQQTGRRADLDEAIEMGRRAVEATERTSPHRPGRLDMLGTDLSARFEESKSLADLDEAIAVRREAIAATPADDPALAVRLDALGIDLSQRFARTGSAEDLDAAIDAGRLAVDAARQAVLPDLARYLKNLFIDLRRRFDLTGSPADLDATVEAGREALSTTPADDPGRTPHALALAVLLAARFDARGEPADLDAAIDLRRDVVRATPDDDQNLAHRLDALAVDLSMRFARFGRLADIHEAVDVGTRALRATPHGHRARPRLANNLGVDLRTRYRRLGNLDDINRAVELGRHAADLARTGDDRGFYLSNLGVSLWDRFQRTGETGDLDEAVAASRRALDDTPDDHAERGTRLANLAVDLATRFLRRTTASASLGDLAEAIDLGRAAVAATPAGHPSLPGRLTNLGSDLREMFDQTGDVLLLDEAIELCQRAIDATPEDHPDRPVYLSNLASELRARSQRTGHFEDLEMAVRLRRRAIESTPAEHPDHSSRLVSLAEDLGVTFMRLGRLADLDAAVEFFRQAIKVTPPDHADLCRRLDGLSNSLTLRFQRTGRADDVDEAVDVGRRALAGTAADDPERAYRAANLAHTLSEHYTTARDVANLNEAVELARMAADAFRAGHPTRAPVQSLLGSTLAHRFLLADTVSDIDEAIRVCRDAAEAAPAGLPDRAGRFLNLGNALEIRFRFTSAHAEDDRADAIGAFREAAGTVTARTTIRADGARRWGEMAADARDWAQAVEAYELAIMMSARVIPRGMPRRDQEYALARLAGLPSEAAAACLQAGDSYRAVQLLEQGRGLLLAQTLETRTDVTELHSQHPLLAERFSGLCAELDRVEEAETLPAVGRPDAVRDPAAAPAHHLPDSLEEAERRRRLAGELDGVVAEIRRQPGFAHFLAAPPPPADTPLAGPVVLLNVTSLRSDALILRPSGVDVVRLPEASPEAVRDNVAATTVAAGARTAEAERRLEGVLGWLWDAIAAPVLDHLGLIGRPATPGQRPRLWWSPSGLLSFLPLHAAGYHDRPGGTAPRTVLDCVVSSYALTLRTLVHSRSRPVVPEAPGAAKILAVAMPETPGESGLPAAMRDVAFLRQRFPGAVEVLSGRDATHTSVSNALPGAGWAHVACHGISDAEAPSASRLLLWDHQSRPLTVVDVAKLRLHRAELAFLAACSTGQGSARLPDEAIHLASAFQVAGYRHVVATLWPTSDRSCAQVTRSVYMTLSVGGGPPNSGAVAVALHDAALAVRRRHPHRPSQWAGYIHLGA